MNRALIAVVAALAPIVIAAAPVDFTVPASVPVEHLRVRQFDFSGGRSAPLKLGYRTLGSPHKGPDGSIDNAVVLLHGTGGSGAAFLGPKAGLLFGPGAPFDITRTYVILPDTIGIGSSTKPSDSLGVNFPHYDYGDMVKGVRTVLAELKVTKVRAVVGTSMGAMLGWTWAEAYPNEIDTLVAMGGWPTAVAGRNLVWRIAARDALLVSPLPGGSGARVATGIILVATVPAALLTKLAPDAPTLQHLIDARLDGAPDSVDFAFQLDAVRNYSPAAGIERVTAKVVELNFADDILYPVAERPPLPARFTRITVPASAATSGHATLGEPSVWMPLVAPALRAALAR
ncbi:alpha/beta fold hydrolase [Glacieibacterium megasporae]|uniref:alpha/beta fold hydrolase n=1 Tax=Glacieibacterium megasporae TaxID=2835787 RepID=UPI001C1E81CC|nr:alpha/beta fold hydrolase [Polymorphobacter megasporae]UAJ09299.1 alpha/beta fold hydrolase [Polymorphobacter megasporae]